MGHELFRMRRIQSYLVYIYYFFPAYVFFLKLFRDRPFSYFFSLFVRVATFLFFEDHNRKLKNILSEILEYAILNNTKYVYYENPILIENDMYKDNKRYDWIYITLHKSLTIFQNKYFHQNVRSFEKIEHCDKIQNQTANIRQTEYEISHSARVFAFLFCILPKPFDPHAFWPDFILPFLSKARFF